MIHINRYRVLLIISIIGCLAVGILGLVNSADNPLNSNWNENPIIQLLKKIITM